MAVVDVVLTAGQSQMQGVGTGVDAPATDPLLAWDWNGGPGFVQVADPSSSTAPYKAQTGSLVPMFVNTFTSVSGRPLLVVRSAVGGTSLLVNNAGYHGYWELGGNRFDASVTRCLDALSALAGMGHTVGHLFVIWAQGYADAKTGNDLELYQAANAALLSRWRTALSDPDLKVYMEEIYAPDASAPALAARCNYLRDAQLAAVAETPGLEIAFDEGSEYASRGYLKPDLLHFNQAGLNAMGFAFAEYVANDLGFDPPEPPPVVERGSLVARLLMQTEALEPTIPPEQPITYQTAGAQKANGSTTAVAVPAGVEAGDIILIFATSVVGSATYTWPAGFVEKARDTQGSCTHAVAWKRATTADSGTYTVIPSSGNFTAQAHRISGAITSGDPFRQTPHVAKATGSEPNTSLTGVPAGDLLFHSVGSSHGSLVLAAPAGYTNRNTGGIRLGVTSKAQTVTGDTGNVNGGNAGASTPFIGMLFSLLD